MKFVVLGTSQFTLSCAQGLLDNGCDIAAIISLPEENRTNNSIDIEKYALENNIIYKEYLNINSDESIVYLESLQVDYFLSTWPYMISKRVLEIPKKYVIGTHPTPLPMNRGRHPLHWMIVLGIHTSTLSFFVMNENVDDGDLLFQQSFVVSDDVVNANINMCNAGFYGAVKLTEILKLNPNFKGIKQAHEYQNIWRKRNEHDITIDPRMSASMIVNIVNSFCEPYPMARLYIDKEFYLNVSAAKKLDTVGLPGNWHNYEHGYIFNHDNNRLKVRVEDAVVELLVDEKIMPDRIPENKKIFPPSYYFS